MPNRKLRAFTFIEVMIAIAVFSIGIIVVLQMIIKNLNTVDSIRLKNTATILAQE
ncbi:MAG: prepilin-type N-terminal cleavage/methylation domain-containing protein [bacterium]|nr:prepilin-type N-terminal cleavage/methylation domain-containing protein [bacterium]